MRIKIVITFAIIACVFVVNAFAFDTSNVNNTNELRARIASLESQLNAHYEHDMQRAIYVAQIRCAFRVYEDISATFERDDNTRFSCYRKIIRGR